MSFDIDDADASSYTAYDQRVTINMAVLRYFGFIYQLSGTYNRHIVTSGVTFTFVQFSDSIR